MGRQGSGCRRQPRDGSQGCEDAGWRLAAAMHAGCVLRAIHTYIHTYCSKQALSRPAPSLVKASTARSEGAWRMPPALPLAPLQARRGCAAPLGDDGAVAARHHRPPLARGAAGAAQGGAGRARRRAGADTRAGGTGEAVATAVGRGLQRGGGAMNGTGPNGARAVLHLAALRSVCPACMHVVVGFCGVPVANGCGGGGARGDGKVGAARPPGRTSRFDDAWRCWCEVSAWVGEWGVVQVEGRTPQRGPAVHTSNTRVVPAHHGPGSSLAWRTTATNTNTTVADTRCTPARRCAPR